MEITFSQFSGNAWLKFLSHPDWTQRRITYFPANIASTLELYLNFPCWVLIHRPMRVSEVFSALDRALVPHLIYSSFRCWKKAQPSNHQQCSGSFLGWTRTYFNFGLRYDTRRWMNISKNTLGPSFFSFIIKNNELKKSSGLYRHTVRSELRGQKFRVLELYLWLLRLPYPELAVSEPGARTVCLFSP